MNKTAKKEPLDLREFRIEKLQSRCRHFTGFIVDELCGAGVKYQEQNGKVCMPCVPGLIHDRLVIACDKFNIMSREEAGQLADKSLEESNKAAKAIFGAKDHANSVGFGKGNGGFGQILCPACETGSLRYTVSSLNGHMHAQCSTPKCISFME